jgi:oligopeptide transport system substrate-binding protein
MNPAHMLVAVKFLSGKSRALLLLSTVLSSLLILGCSGESRVEQGNREGVLYIDNYSEPQSIDPHVTTEVSGSLISLVLLEGLVTFNPYTLEPEPGVARSWDFSDDRKTLTFNLNPRAKWSNGDPVTAGDFVWSWRRALTPALGNQMAEWLYSIENAKAFHTGKIDNPELIGATALDPHTLQVQLEYPDAFIINKLGYAYTAPVHRATVEAHGKSDERYSGWARLGSFVGNGPFILEEWKLYRHILVRKNPLYWDADNVKLEGIVFLPIENAVTAEKMFRSGQLHVTRSTPNDKITYYREQPDSPLRDAPYTSSYFLILNLERPPLDDVRVRRALTLALDKRQLVGTVLQDTVLATDNFVPLGMPDYTHAQGLSFDPERARALLAEAGFPDGEGFPKLEYAYNTHELNRTVAIAVQQMWKTVLNIDVELINQEWKVYLNKLDTGEFDIARMGWSGDVYPGAFLDPVKTGGLINRMSFSEPRYDEIINSEVRTTVDPKKLMATYTEAEQILLDQAPLIPIYSNKDRSLVQPSVKGMPSNPARYVNFKYLELDPTTPSWRPRENSDR